jgi:hypothetical protein
MRTTPAFIRKSTEKNSGNVSATCSPLLGCWMKGTDSSVYDRMSAIWMASVTAMSWGSCCGVASCWLTTPGPPRHGPVLADAQGVAALAPPAESNDTSNAQRKCLPERSQSKIKHTKELKPGVHNKQLPRSSITNLCITYETAPTTWSRPQSTASQAPTHRTTVSTNCNLLSIYLSTIY